MKAFYTKILLLVVIVCPLASCCAKRAVTTTNTLDSVRIVRETKYVEKIRDSIVYVSLPVEVKEVIRRDSSHLETSAASSFARIEPDGSLLHALKNKPQPIPVPVQVRDTEAREVEKEISVEREVVKIYVDKPVGKWKIFLQYSGILAWVIIIAFVAVKIFRRGR